MAAKGISSLQARRVPFRLPPQLAEALSVHVSPCVVCQAAKSALGKNVDKVREICEIGRVDLEPELLKEWIAAAP